MKKVILGIGIPGSGKSTILKQFAEKNSYTYICPDDIRKELTGSEVDQSKNQEVWSETYKRSSESLGKGETIVLDATFTNPSQRKNFIAFVRDNGAEKIQGIFVDTPFEVAMERNSLRERKVPSHVIERMKDELNKFPPEIEDDFDSLFTLDENQELIKLEASQGENIVEKEFKMK